MTATCENCEREAKTLVPEPLHSGSYVALQVCPECFEDLVLEGIGDRASELNGAVQEARDGGVKARYIREALHPIPYGKAFKS